MWVSGQHISSLTFHISSLGWYVSFRATYFISYHSHIFSKHLNSLFLIFVTETISRNNSCLKTFFLKWIFANYLFSISKSELVSLIFVFKSFLFVYFLVVFNNFFYQCWWLLSLEMTRVNPDRSIFSINVELTSAFLLYRGLVHYHPRILNIYICVCNDSIN